MIVYQQERDYTCGVACIRTVLDLFRLRVPTERELIPLLRSSPKYGTLPGPMVHYLKGRGLDASYKAKRKVMDLIKPLLEGNYTIVDWMSDWGGHWSVVVGLEGDKLLLADPAGRTQDGITKVQVDRFESMWWDNIPPPSEQGVITVGKK